MKDMIDSTKENIEWIKPIKGHEEYLITNTGMVWSRKSQIWLKPWEGDKEGHLRIYLGGKTPLIHRLVYQAFVGLIPKGYVVHHIDYNPINNLYTNLKVMTRAEHIRLHHKGQKCSQITKQKIGKANKGKVAWNKGIKKNKN